MYFNLAEGKLDTHGHFNGLLSFFPHEGEKVTSKDFLILMCTYSVPSAVCSAVGTTLVLSELIDSEVRKSEHLKQQHFKRAFNEHDLTIDIP